jgi:hypothetical protein
MLNVACNPVRYQIFAAETGRCIPTHDLILNYMGFHASDSAQAGVDHGELYDLKNDPGESMNLLRCFPRLTRTSRSRLAMSNSSPGAELPR